MRPAFIAALAFSSGCAAPEFEAFRLEYDHAPDQVVLVEASYAVLIFWRETDVHPRFNLYDVRTRRHLATDSWLDFLGHISELPEGIVIQRFNTCCVPCDYAMPVERHEELDSVMKEGRRTWRIDPLSGLPVTLICTCESNGFRFPPR